MPYFLLFVLIGVNVDFVQITSFHEFDKFVAFGITQLLFFSCILCEDLFSGFFVAADEKDHGVFILAVSYGLGKDICIVIFLQY